jgi:DNA-binding transcriptional LysR family regulator
MRVFASVVEEGSFTAAAQRLGVAVPHVSRAVVSLETHLRTRLLHRTTRRIALTEAGERYLARCEEILACLVEAEAEAAEAHFRPAGRLRVHATASFGQSYVVPAVVQYQLQYPAVSVDITLSQEVPDLLEDGYDISLRLSASQLPDSSEISHSLGTIYSVLCASPSYLAQYGRPAEVSDLRGHNCLPLVSSLFSPEHWLFEGPNGSERFDLPRSKFQTNVPDALAAAVRGGAGIGVLPSSTALSGVSDGSLVRVLPAYRFQQLNVYAIHASRKFVDAKIKTFVETLRRHIPLALFATEAALHRIDPVALD